MKAKEYFEEFEQQLMDENKTYQCGIAMMTAMCEEVEQIAKDRKAVKDEAYIAIIKEQNQKWNAVCRLFEKKYGVSPIKRNGFAAFWEDRLPKELGGKLLPVQTEP